MSARTIPNIDYSKIDAALKGMWIVVRVGEDQEILGRGQTPGEAMNAALRDYGLSRDDDSAVLTRVPTPTAISYMGRSGE